MITKDVVKKVAKLAYISLSEEEEAIMEKDLAQIFNWIDILEQAKIPEEIPSKEPAMLLRTDEVTEKKQREELLKNAPKKGHHMFMVPKFIEY